MQDRVARRFQEEKPEMRKPILVSPQTHSKAQKLAKIEGRSIPKELDYLITNRLKELGKK